MLEQTGQSLLIRARRLQAFGRAENEKRNEKQDHQRLTLALQKLEDAIAVLESCLKTHRALVSLGIPLSPLPDIHKAPAELRDYVNSIARPTFERITGATGKVNRTTEKIRDDLNSQWQSWASEQIRELPLYKTALLTPTRKRQVDTWLLSLRSDARGSAGAASAQQFSVRLEAVQAELGQASEDSILEMALRKIMDTPPITLAGLSDEELAALRNDQSVAEQIMLSRR